MYKNLPSHCLLFHISAMLRAHLRSRSCVSYWDDTILPTKMSPQFSYKIFFIFYNSHQKVIDSSNRSNDSGVPEKNVTGQNSLPALIPITYFRICHIGFCRRTPVIRLPLLSRRENENMYHFSITQRISTLIIYLQRLNWFAKQMVTEDS